MKYLFLLFLILTTACSTNLNYAPQILEKHTTESLLSNIKRGLRTQIQPYNVDTVEVDQERFTTTKQTIIYNYYRSCYYWGPNMITVPVTQTVYYDNIGKIELYSRSSHFIVLIRQKNTDKIIYRFGTDDKELATRFIDALNTLSINTKEK